MAPETQLVGAAAMVNNVGDADRQRIIQLTLSAPLRSTPTRPDSVTTPWAIPRSFRNITGAQNTAVGDLALENNDATGAGMPISTRQLALWRSLITLLVVQNTVVGAGAGPNVAAGFNNTYVGQFVGDNNGTPIADEDLTIRIADVSTDGFGSAACFIGGIFNNPQPVGGNVVVVTLNTVTDQLGFDPAVGRSGNAPAVPHRNAPQPRVRPQPSAPSHAQ